MSIPFTDDASVQDSIHCLAVCLYLHLQPADIAQRMAQLEPVAMRLEVMQGVRGCTLINDTYNSDVTSLDIALDFMNRRPEQGNKPKRSSCLTFCKPDCPPPNSTPRWPT